MYERDASRQVEWGATFVDSILEQGSATNTLVTMGRENIRSLEPADIADIAHFLCVLHGRHPGVVDHAANHIMDEEARSWLARSLDAFAAERTFLTRLTVAAGPITGTSGEEDCTNAMAMQAKALEFLATSDRKGCAAGVAIAFSTDWLSVRDLLESIAERLQLTPAPNGFADLAQNAELAKQLANDDLTARAMHFGREQVLAQIDSFWALIAARKRSREVAAGQ